MRPNVRTLIVDDEPLARERLRTLLSEEPGVEIVGECGDGCQAVVAIEELKPDLVFLDVQVPNLDGFRILGASAPIASRAIVFVTAHDKYALRAFDVRARRLHPQAVRARAAPEGARARARADHAREVDRPSRGDCVAAPRPRSRPQQHRYLRAHHDQGGRPPLLPADGRHRLGRGGWQLRQAPRGRGRPIFCARR